MSIKVLNGINELVKTQGIFYIASGKLTQSILQSIVTTIRCGVYDNSKNEKYDDIKIDNLIIVTIEMVQNISQYKKNIENYHHDLVVITTKDNIKIYTSNLANRENKEKLVKTIDFLKSLDDEGLRKHLRKSAKENIDKDANSSGLGLIEMAILSKNNIEYECIEHTQDDVFQINITTIL